MSTRTPSRSNPESPERREALGTLARATVAAVVAAVLPRIPAASAGGNPPPSAEEWAAFVQAARAAIGPGVEAWSVGSSIHGGEMNGSALFLAPGTLSGPSFAASVAQAVAGAGAPPAVAGALGQACWQVWETWSRTYTLSVPRAVKAFAAVAAPEVPATPLASRTLRSGSAPGRIGLTAPVLLEILTQTVPGAQSPEAAGAIQGFATWYAAAFGKWFNKAKLQNLVLGKGPIPTFAPPYVPVGPVVGGIVDGESVVLAPAFG